MSILVISDIQEGALRSVNAEVYTAAVALGASTDQQVATLLIGSSDLQSMANVPAAHGISRIVVLEDTRLAQFSPDAYAQTIADAIKQLGATTVLMGATFTGKDVMARVAQILDAGLAQDCIEVASDGNGLLCKRPMYAGKLIADVRVHSSPALATIRPKSYKPAEKQVEAAVEQLSVEVPDPKVVVESYEGGNTDKLDVTEADIIVSGGRGMQGADRWGIIEELADLLGAATGCSRPVSDDGWRPHEEHIGQTGKTVSPDLYVACGISGAIQHVAGVSSSKYIVAINKDPEAPIFKVADYGIVGDVFDVLPAMTDEVRKLKATD